MSERDSICASAEKLQVEYRDIPGFPGYRVGSDGTVWTRRWRGWHLLNVTAWRRMKLIPDHGYLCVHLGGSEGGVKFRKLPVHVVVLLAFVGPCPDGMEACHFPDRAKTNNSLANLRWGTPVDNANDKKLHGTTARGSRNARSRLAESSVIEIVRLLKEGVSQTAIATRFGVAPNTIGSIANGRTWAHVSGGPIDRSQGERE